uniref:GAR domain-containing protein n=1 Tax=Meloidogyne javanica TaxID=6303 RepID=A0A915N437_MELJA
MGVHRQTFYFPSQPLFLPFNQDSLHSECLRRNADIHSLISQLGQLQRSQLEQIQTIPLNSEKEARSHFVGMREKLNSYSTEVAKQIAEADRLCVECADSLSPEQFHLLKENRHCLQHTFERLERQADAILARLDLATALLLEFTSRASSFQSWVFEHGRQLDALRAESGDPEKLDYLGRAFEDLNELILSKRPELNSIEQLAQRIEVEIAAYVDEINDRGGGMSSPICEGIALVTTTQLLQQHQVRETVLRAQEDYEELTEQSEELADFVNEISMQAPLLENVIENTRELFAHLGGSEAIALQMRTDQLKQRYNNLADDADSKIAIWEKALTLAENLLDGQAELKKHLEDVEEDLQNLSQVSLEEQFQLISTIESDLGPAREQLESIQLISCELQRLTTETRANQLAKESAELLRYFNSVADTVTKKAELLSKAERQSRLIFDVLDFWIDWFNEVQEQIVNAEKPAVDIEQLKQQLKQQRQLNDEISSERNGLRDMIAEASKVARDLNLTLGGQEGQEALLTKVERTKKMAEETAELGSERTAELEQAFALAKELDSEYTDLNDYMDGFERELCACDPITTGMPAKILLAQQQHNNNILQQIQSQRPMVNKFERNVAALRELCSEIDEQNLKQISENIAERFEELVHAFQERGDVLTSSLEHSAHLGDRLNMLLSNLSAALEQLHSQEPPSSRPPIIRRQLAEMSAMFDLLHQREPSFLAMKTQCSEQIELAKQQNLNYGQEPSTLAEMHQQRLAELDTRWTELKQAAEGRRLQLETILPLAERFWIQLDLAQQSVVQIRQHTDQFGMSAAAEDLFDSPVKQLQQRQNQLQSLQNGISECSQGVQQAHLGGLELCNELLGAEEEQSFVQQHLAALQAQWDAFLAHFTQMSSSLSLAVNQASFFSLQFHSLLQQLTSFLAAKENQASNIITDNPLNSVDSVREQLQIVDMLRRELDEAAIGREQLNQMGAELCAVMAATKNTSMGDTDDPTLSIRQPLGELNQRWNVLLKRLLDSQQRLERALLDMGQFSQAHAQLVDWIDKTLTTLDGVEGEWRLYSDSGASGLKHIEIALCKLRILQNDISAHQPSYEAILTAGAQILRQEDSSAAASTQPMIEHLVANWSKLDERTQQLFNELEQNRAESTSRNNDMEKWRLWLVDLLTEMRTNRPIGGLPETAIAQLDEFRVIQSDVEQRKPQFEEYLNSLEESMEDLKRSEVKNGKEDRTISQVKKLRADWKTLQMQEMQDWLLEAENHLAMVPPISRLVETLETQLDTHKTFNDSVQTKCQFMKELNNKGIRMQLSCEKKDAIPMKNKLVSLKHRTDKLAQRSNERLRTLTIALDDSRLFFVAQQELIDWIEEQLKLLDEKETEKMGTGNLLGEHAPPAEKRRIESANDQLGNEWTELGKRTLKRQRSLEEALIQSGHFDEVLAELLEWLKKELPPIENELLTQNYFGDIDTMNTLMREHFELVERADTRKPNVLKVQERAKKILASKGGDPQELDKLAISLETLDGQWKRLESSIAERDRRFTAALKKAVDLSEMMHELGTTLQDIEGRVRRLGLPWEEQDVLTEQNQLEKLQKEFMSEHPTLEKQLELARELQSRSHPRAEKPLKELITTANTRWESLDALLNDKSEKLRLRLEEIRKHERQQNDLFNYLEEKQGQLDYYRGECHDEGQQARLQTLIDEQQMFKSDLQQRQPEFDEVMKIAAKRRLHSGRHSENFGILSGNKGGINNENEEGKDERKAHLDEIDRLKNFTFEEWRERYLAWNDHGKARVSDLFRRIDKLGTGRVPRQQFIDGIISSKFPTTLLEMNKVANEFDGGDGLISSKEFMNALRYDPNKRIPPKSETERIHEEIARETARCTCVRRFPILHLSTDKDKVQYGFGFGGSMKRMVRILRSTVMVRVGGGWEALDGFLSKHDPCRAKGRINVDLLPLTSDYHLRPIGAIDAIGEFHRKESTSSNSGIAPIAQPSSSNVIERVLGYSPGQPGPIMKIREKTERSLPMFKRAADNNNGSTISIPQLKQSQSDHSSIIDDIYGSSRIPRPASSRQGGSDVASTPSRPASRSSDIGSDIITNQPKGVRFTGINTQ